jgi:hypothetical protein
MVTTTGITDIMVTITHHLLHNHHTMAPAAQVVQVDSAVPAV